MSLCWRWDLPARSDLPSIVNSMPASLLAWYPLAVTAATLACGLLLRDRCYFVVAAASLAAWIGYSGIQTYERLRRVVAGLDQIVCGPLVGFRVGFEPPRSA